MAAKPIKSLQLYYTMIQFLINLSIRPPLLLGFIYSLITIFSGQKNCSNLLFFIVLQINIKCHSQNTLIGNIVQKYMMLHCSFIILYFSNDQTLKRSLHISVTNIPIVSNHHPSPRPREMRKRNAWDKDIKAKSFSALTNTSWKVNMAFSKVGCSKIQIKSKIWVTHRPSHYRCILSVTEKYCWLKTEQLLYIYVVENKHRISGFNKYLVHNIFITYKF